MVLKPKTNKLNNIIIIDDDSKSIKEQKKYKMKRNSPAVIVQKSTELFILMIKA